VRLREDQIHALEDETGGRFIYRVVAHLRQHHAGALTDLSDETVAYRVRIGVVRAWRYGLTWQSSIAAFVALMFVIAPNFDEHPVLRRILNDRSVEPGARIDHLMNTATAEDWAEAAAAADSSAWQRF
jgi:hypothetical protein